MAISGWFCSKGFGPGPSRGTAPATVRNGLAGPTMSPKKKAVTANAVTMAHATSGSAARSRKRQAMSAR